MIQKIKDNFKNYCCILKRKWNALIYKFTFNLDKCDIPEVNMPEPTNM